MAPTRRAPSGRAPLLAMLVLLMAAVAARAQSTGGSSITSPEKEFIRFTLPNGLDVLVIENHLVPIATIDLAVRNGSFTEGPQFAGLSHLYEHMFFKANGRYRSSEEFMGHLNDLGAVFNAETREEVVDYFFTLPVSNLEEGIKAMASSATSPVFDSGELEREREVVLGEFDRHEANPWFEFGRAIDSAMWGDMITRKEPLGQRNVIKSATPAKMREIQKRYYIPNNSLLIVAGDVDSTTVNHLVTKYFSSWERGPDPFKNNPPPMAKPLTRDTALLVPAPGVDLAQVQYNWHGPSVGLDNASTYAADVLIFILQQPQSRFQRRLVESGLTQAAGIGYYTQRYVGPITVQAVTTPDKVRRTVDVLWNEIQDLDSPDYFTDEELATAKAILRVRALYESEETSEWVHTPAFWWSTTGLDYYIHYIDNLSKVTREDIQRYIRTYIKNKPYVLGVSSSPQALQELNVQPKELLHEAVNQ